MIPSEAEVRLDVRALPDEDVDKLIEEMKRVIDEAALLMTGGSSFAFKQ